MLPQKFTKRDIVKIIEQLGVLLPFNFLKFSFLLKFYGFSYRRKKNFKYMELLGLKNIRLFQTTKEKLLIWNTSNM